MSKTSGYIAFPDDFIPSFNGQSNIFVSRSKYDFLTAAMASGKVGKIFVPGVGTFLANRIEVGEVAGYMMGLSGDVLMLLPYAEEVENDIVYGIIIASGEGE